jgi:hypothetical protein
MMNEDWRYTPERLALREQVLGILLKKYGGPLNDDCTSVNENQPIYEFAHDWVSQGNARADGIIKYYEAYYK